jgi:hypothetical protein
VTSKKIKENVYSRAAQPSQYFHLPCGTETLRKMPHLGYLLKEIFVFKCSETKQLFLTRR